MAAIIDKITDTVGRMSKREQLLVFGLAGSVLFLIILLLGYLTLEGLDERRTKNQQITQVLERLERNRHRLMATKKEDARLDVRLGRTPPALQGHLDKLAKRLEVEVKDYSPAKPKPLGKKKAVLEKSIVLRLYNIDLPKLTKFLNGIEQGGYLMMTTRLRIQPRLREHEKLDVTKLRISTYEKVKAKEKKGKGAKKGRRGMQPKRKGKK